MIFVCGRRLIWADLGCKDGNSGNRTGLQGWVMAFMLPCILLLAYPSISPLYIRNRLFINIIQQRITFHALFQNYMIRKPDAGSCVHIKNNSCTCQL